jgi:hypothetical protein
MQPFVAAALAVPVVVAKGLLSMRSRRDRYDSETERCVDARGVGGHTAPRPRAPLNAHPFARLPPPPPQKKHTKTNSSDGALDLDGSLEPGFVCERVCASDRLLRKLGGLSKEPSRGSCVTVCGASPRDACAEACQRAVCTVPHRVPAWNDACVRRCAAECLKGRAGGE